MLEVMGGSVDLQAWKQGHYTCHKRLQVIFHNEGVSDAVITCVGNGFRGPWDLTTRPGERASSRHLGGVPRQGGAPCSLLCAKYSPHVGECRGGMPTTVIALSLMSRTPT